MSAALTGRTHGRTERDRSTSRNPLPTGAVHAWLEAVILRAFRVYLDGRPLLDELKGIEELAMQVKHLRYRKGTDLGLRRL